MHTGRKKIFRRALGIVGILLLFPLVLVLVLPYVVNLEFVRQKIMAAVSHRIEGKFAYQKAEFSLFPRPMAVLHRAQAAIPPNAIAEAETITIAPRLAALLRGEVRVNRIQIRTPTLALELPDQTLAENRIPLPSAILPENLSPLLKLLESEAPKLSIEVEKGRLALRVERREVFWFQDIQGRMVLPPDHLRIDLTCKSNLGEKISVGARIRSKDSNGTANIQVSHLNPQALLDYLAPGAGLNLEGSRGNLELALEIDRGKIFRGKIKGASPALVFQRGEKKSSLKGIALSGAFQMEGNQAAFSLAELSLQSPRARLGGEFQVDPAAPLFRLEITARGIDVPPVREIVTDWAGGSEPVRTIFDVVREGTIPEVSIKTHGCSAAELGDLENISVRGNLSGGRIFLSESLTGLNGIHFDVRKAQGEVLLDRGILESKDFAGQWEKTSVSHGSLKLRLKGGDAPFHLEFLAEADLAPFPPFLKKILKNRTFSEELDRFRDLQGRARGKLILGETLHSLRPKIQILEMSLSSRYDRIPYPLRIETVQGAYDRGALTFQNLSGAVGQNSFEGVSARIALGDPPDLALSSGKVSIFLEELLPFLKNIEKLKGPLRDIEALKGNATLSSLSLSGPLDRPEKWDYRLEGEIGNLTGRYGPVPFPLQIETAGGSFDGKNLRVRNLTGTAGKSAFAGLSAQIDLGESAAISILAGKSRLVLEEIFPWLAASGRLKGPLQEIKSLNGVAALSSVALKGPLLQPEKWDYRLAGEVEKLILEASAMPGPLTVPAAKFEIDPERILLQDAQVNFLDAVLEGSAAGNGWQQGLRGLEGDFRGNLGARAVEWASARYPLPEGTRLQAPFSISEAHVGWKQATGVSFKGNCQWPGGPRASIDLLYSPDAVQVDRLLIADDRSRADVAAGIQKRDLFLDFKGILERPTVDRILLRSGLPEGSIRGEFQAHLVRDNPFASTARGKLVGTGLRLALPVEPPLTLHSFTLNADQKNFRVQSADLDWEERRLTAEGVIDLLPEAVRGDLNISVDGLSWEKLENQLKGGPGKPQFPPFQGRIGLKSSYFEYGKYTWKPLEAEIHFSPEEVKVTVGEARVCGISTAGILRISPRETALDFQPFAKDREISADAACLLGRPLLMTGNYLLDGRIKGQGQGPDLIRSLNGPWQIEARDGRFYHGSLAIKILSSLSLEELFTGDKKNLGKGEMSYKTLRAKGELESGKVILRELAMNTPEMNLFAQGEIDLQNRGIDLVVAVAPLKTVDWVLRRIPLLGYILGGTLVSIPVGIKGDLDDPEIIPLDPAEIGLGFLGIMKRTLMVPFKLIKPIFKAPPNPKDPP